MSIEISSETSMWTDITITNANGDLLFDGALTVEQNGWVLSRTVKGYQEPVTTFAARRSYLGALAASLAWVEKAHPQREHTPITVEIEL